MILTWPGAFQHMNKKEDKIFREKERPKQHMGIVWSPMQVRKIPRKPMTLTLHHAGVRSCFHHRVHTNVKLHFPRLRRAEHVLTAHTRSYGYPLDTYICALTFCRESKWNEGGVWEKTASFSCATSHTHVQEMYSSFGVDQPTTCYFCLI